MDSVFIRKSWVPGNGFIAASKLAGADRSKLRVALREKKREREVSRLIGSKPSSIRFDGDAYFENHKDRQAITGAQQALHPISRPAKQNPNNRLIDSDSNGMMGIPFTVKTGRRGTILGTSAKASRSDNRIIAHEMEHARPKRNSYRMFQIAKDPAKLGREEARADYMSGSGNVMRKGGRWTHYSRAAQGDRQSQQALQEIHPRFTSQFTNSYRELQEKLHGKGVPEGSRAKSNNKYSLKTFGVQDRPDNLKEKIRSRFSRAKS